MFTQNMTVELGKEGKVPSSVWEDGVKDVFSFRVETRTRGRQIRRTCRLEIFNPKIEALRAEEVYRILRRWRSAVISPLIAAGDLSP